MKKYCTVDEFHLDDGCLNGEHMTFLSNNNRHMLDDAPDGHYLHFDYKFSLPNGRKMDITIFRLCPIMNNVHDTYVFRIRLGHGPNDDIDRWYNSGSDYYYCFRNKSIRHVKGKLYRAEEKAGIRHGELIKLFCRLNQWFAYKCGCLDEIWKYECSYTTRYDITD